MKRVLSSLIAALSITAAHGETVTLTPTKDSDVYSYTGGGSGAPTSTTYSLGVSSTPVSYTTLHSQKSLVQFSLTSLGIPAAEIGSAKLRLYVLDTDPTYGSVSPGDVYVYLQGADWGTVTAISPKWASFVPTTLVGKIPVATTSVNKWVELDVTSAVVAWLSGTSNYGLILQPEADRTTPVLNVNFAAMELASAGFAPQLVITRGVATVVPPVLKIFSNNGQLTLEWPVTGSTGWSLQWSEDLTNWQANTATATNVNGQWRVVPATGTKRAFFRLTKP